MASLIDGKILEKLPAAVSIAYTYILVLFGWVLFDTNTLSDAGKYLAAMFGAGGTFIDDFAKYTLVSNKFILVVCILISGGLGDTFIKYVSGRNKRFAAAASIPVMLIGLLVCTAYLVDATYNPFLYFRF